MPLSDLKLDPDTHDLAWENGNLVIERDEGEALAQRIRIALRTWKGEWYLDADFGVDYRGKILIRNPSRASVLSEIQRVVLARPGVKRIVRLDVEFDKAARTFRITNGLIESDSGELVAIGA